MNAELSNSQIIQMLEKRRQQIGIAIRRIERKSGLVRALELADLYREADALLVASVAVRDAKYWWDGSAVRKAPALAPFTRTERIVVEGGSQ